MGTLEACSKWFVGIVALNCVEVVGDFDLEERPWSVG